MSNTMSQAQQPQEFAFGRNEIDNCVCPAMAAGMNPCGSGDDHIPGLLEAAEWYDRVVTNRDVDGFHGIIGRQVAMDAWIEVIEGAVAETDSFEAEAQAAIDVAVELGWISREDYEL